MKSSLSKKLVTLSTSILMGVTPLANTTTAFASTSNVISTKTSTVTVSKKTYLLNQNGKKLPVVLAKGEKVKVTAVLNLGKKTLYKIGTSNYWIDSSKTNGKVHYKNYGTNYTIQTRDDEINSKPQAQSTIIKLKKNAIPYNENGKKRTDLVYTYIKKNTVLNYYGTKIINGKTYYNLGDGVYINGANVSSTSQN